MLDKMSNASRLIDKLLPRELVSREMCVSDRRRMDILITQKGLALLQDIDEQQNIINVYGVLEEEAKILNKLLDKFRIQ
jgi:DNA-binding MarR family transcriptional regulator